ncbi:polysaccharide deacetylase-related protein [Enhygromyxa salina]|uniref:Polysaccharide deacetylase-related protein n=1 Tax=Enhygromyxa salina TaxID=215803 RepID=A0A0C2D5R4_9BACT|nr:polysaccharide deacetylase-related protein [Enhygromyxa salina]
MLAAVTVFGCKDPSHSQVPATTDPATTDPDPDQPAADPLVPVHLSFDDAPRMDDPGTPLRDAAELNRLNDELIAVLQDHGANASVFYNCDRLVPGERTIEAWDAAGMTVGNHTASHVNLAEVGLEAWLDDVRRCDLVLRERLSAPPTWLRYPYLSEGHTPELRDGAREALAAMGYANAHVTAATTEWLLAFAYRYAKQAGDTKTQAALVEAYRAHMLGAVEAARELARFEVERETAQVVLFHVNELAVDHLATVLDDYEAAGYTFVGIEEAMADPVFTREDRYVGGGGISWLARIHDPEQPRPPYWFGQEEGRLTEAFGHLLNPNAYASE